jgi:CSLREA domain-containing protein
MKKRHFLFWYLTCAFILSSSPVSALTFNVNVFDDPAPQSAPNGCNNGGRCSLREAVLAANFDSNEDIIVLQAGHYTLTIQEGGTPETGDLDIFGPSGQTGNTVIRGAGADATIIEAALTLQDRILEIETGFTTSVEISGLTLQKGRTTSLGGALYGHGNTLSLTLTNVNMKDNQSTQAGGALYFGAGTSSFSMKGGTISENRAGGTGGAFNLPGGGDPKTQFRIENVIFSNNQTSNGNGGGIFHTASPGLVLTSVQLLNNTAVNGSGGGVFSTQAIGPDPLIPLSTEIKNSILRDNKSTSHGGGAYVGASNRVTVENSSFVNNEVLGAGNGGGLYTSIAPADIFIQGNTFSGNVADQGGGLWHASAPFTIREILNSTFSGNQARVAGGGMWINRGDSFFVMNVTVVGNSAQYRQQYPLSE